MLSIMIVDDEEVLHLLYGKLLKHRGHIVVASAFNGDEAAGIYRGLEPSPDLVLMDHRMDMGAADVLLKPFRMDLLLRTVEDAAQKVRD